MDYQIIAQAKTASQATALAVALRAYGFHPLEQGEGGFPGVPNPFGTDGVPVQVPESEAAEASALAQELLKDMAASGP